MKSFSNAGYHDKSLGFDVQKNWILNKNTAVLGISFQNDKCDYKEDSLTLANNKYTFASRDYERGMYSIYGQYSAILNQASTLVFSVREKHGLDQLKPKKI